jgi:hypothetical protein
MSSGQMSLYRRTEMFVSNPEKSILEVAKAIMRESPSTNPKLALLLARYIYQNRGKYVNTINERTTPAEITS